jgi:2-methylisocitrate lyase-like PEP mutase family enzyme
MPTCKEHHMTAQVSLRDLLSRGEQIWAPCIYDCVSARVVEMCGYKALMLSSAELCYSMCGVPSGLMSNDEILWAVSRIAASSPLPLIVDAENGGGSPLAVYRLCQQLAKVGAMGVTIEDSAAHWGAGYHAGEISLLAADVWATNIRAAHDALKGTDCLLIARTECKGGGAPEMNHSPEVELGLEEAIRRCLLGLDAGAEMTLIMDINHADCMDECIQVGRRVPGWKMYPDVKAGQGTPDISLDELAKLGFNFVTSHAAMRGATKGMLDYGRANFKNQSTAYSENDEFGLGHVFHPFVFQEWIDRVGELKAYRSGLS